jgi:hypothetical protein
MVSLYTETQSRKNLLPMYMISDGEIKQNNPQHHNLIALFLSARQTVTEPSSRLNPNIEGIYVFIRRVCLDFQIKFCS